jgi:hypothetical protein
MIDSVLAYPSEPIDPSDASASEDAATLRYDDLIQDGRLRLESAWRPTGRALWSDPDVARVLRSMESGVTTVLSRVSLQASNAPLVPRTPVKTRVRYRFEHTLDGAGEVDRLLFSTWLTATAVGKEGTEELAALAYGQRVFTRLHAPPGQHLVTRIAGFGESGIPEHRGVWEPASALLELPANAQPLEAAPRLDPRPVVFGLSHTDMNQHVNFLMYHRAVEQAAIARFVELGMSAKVVSRESEIGYRKPSFAGETVRIVLRAFRVETALGVVAAVIDDNGGGGPAGGGAGFRDFGSPRVIARMILRP